MVLFATETLAALLAYLCALLLCHDIKTLQDRAQLLLDIGRLSSLVIARTSLLLILYADASSAHTRDLFMRGCGVEGRGCSVRAGCLSSNTCQHLWQSYRICPAVVRQYATSTSPCAFATDTSARCLQVASLALFSGIVQIALFLRLWQSRLVNPSPASSSHPVFDNGSTVSRDNIRLNGLRRKQSCDAPISDSDGEDGPLEERLTRTIVTRQSAACS